MPPAKKANLFEDLSAEQKAALVEKIFGPARQRKALYDAPEFKTLIQTFRDVVARDGVIDQESVKYAKDSAYPFTADEFRMAFEAVMENAPDEAKNGRAETGDFPVVSKHYEGLEFSVLIGQGSVYFVSAKEEAAPKP